MTLYKYAVPARIDVLQRGRIRFTQASAVNDPFELQPHFETLLTTDFVSREITGKPIDITNELVQAYNEQPDEVRSQVSLETFLTFARNAVDSPGGQELFSESMAQAYRLLNDITPFFREGMAKELREKVGILSLSEIPDSELMWAHYADQHRGLVLCFDQSHSFFNQRRGPNDEFYHLRKVVYRELSTDRALVDFTGEDILLTKGPQWEYEREWRMLAPVEDAGESVEAGTDHVYLFDLPSDALEGVILGARASEDLYSQVKELRGEARYRHLAVRRVELDEPNRLLRISKTESV